MLKTDGTDRPSLDELGIKHNTDKATTTRHRDGSVRRGHDYLNFYEQFFEPLRDESLRLLELGVGPEWRSGASLYTFREYFPSAQIIGADIRESSVSVESDRIRIEIGDLGQTEFLERLKAVRPTILIDDASHFWHHQVQAICGLWASVQRGGYYVVEDVHTSFGRFREEGKHSGGQSFTAYRFMQVIAELKQDPTLNFPEIPSDYLESARAIARQCVFIAFARHTVLLKKR
jgi:hypothetical protein